VEIREFELADWNWIGRIPTPISGYEVVRENRDEIFAKLNIEFNTVGAVQSSLM
jgi:hypothetical protein